MDFFVDFRRNRTGIKSRTKYLNRIAYLIATKRNTLKRLALKGSPRMSRRVKVNNRKLQRPSLRPNRKGPSKRTGRFSNVRNFCFRFFLSNYRYNNLHFPHTKYREIEAEQETVITVITTFPKKLSSAETNRF